MRTGMTHIVQRLTSRRRWFEQHFQVEVREMALLHITGGRRALAAGGLRSFP